MIMNGGEGLEGPGDEGVGVSNRFLVFLALGLVLIFVGVAVLMAALAFSVGGSASSGVVIFIGPFPIVFGVGPSGLWLISIGIVLTVLSVVLFIVMNRRNRNFDG